MKYRNHLPLLERMRGAARFMQVVAFAQTALFVFVFYSPSFKVVAQAVVAAPTAPVIVGDTSEARMANALQLLKQGVADKSQSIAERLEAEGGLLESLLNLFGLGTLATEDLTDLAFLRDRLLELDGQIRIGFAQLSSELAGQNFPAAIAARHAAMVADYDDAFATLLSRLDALLAADTLADQEAFIDAMKSWLQLQQFKRRQQPFDPGDLPTQMQKPDPDNVPRLDPAGFGQSLWGGGIKLAALGDFRFDALPDAINPDYLSESDEVVITQAVRDRAASLDHDPVAIYHWVRNNVQWLPTWGAMQDADVTLGSGGGNAFDIATLLIALLRAAQIPARYVHGTVDVEPDRFRNWVGDFDNVQAAQNFASSGGIPITALVAGGAIAKVRMEHIWVEAAIDFHPSRGAVNRNADLWTALDASFKQYTRVPGLDVAGIGGIDANQLANDLLAGATIDAATGSVTGISPASIESVQAQARAALEAHVASNLPNPTIGDTIGGSATIIQEAPVLPTSLPNDLVVRGASFAAIPSTLQSRVTLALDKDLFGQPVDGVSLAFARVNNHKVTVSFAPATPADEQAMAALVPAGLTDLSQLPATIPAYLFNVVPELKLNDQVIKRGSAMRLGDELDFNFRLQSPGRQAQTGTSVLVAGSYVAVATVGGSVSRLKAEQLAARINRTSAIMNGADPLARRAITVEELVGDTLYAGVLAYFGQFLAMNQVSTNAAGASLALLPSAGTWGNVPDVSYFFGIPRAITAGGVIMDLPKIVIAASSHNGDASATFDHVFRSGIIASTLEHVVPEQFFTLENGGRQAVSAVRLIDTAARAGQQIFRISSANLATVLPALNLDPDARNEIRNGVAAGKHAIAHAAPVTVSGWSGSGYIIYDPLVGDGAFKISGGFNGGALKGLDAVLLFLGTKADFNSAIIEKAGSGSSGIFRFWESAGRMITAISFIVGVLSIAASCNGDGVGYFIALYMMLTLMVILLTALIALTVGPIIGFIAGVVLGQILGSLVTHLKGTILCNNP